MKKILLLTIILILMSITDVDAFTYCENNLILRENISVSGIEIPIVIGECPNGCYEDTIATGAACALPEIYIVSIAFFFIMIFIFLIYTLPRALKRGGRRG